MVEPFTPKNVRDTLAKSLDDVGKVARGASAHIVDQATDLRDATVHAVEKLTADDPLSYEEAVVAYNGAFTAMNDKGLSLLRQRERSADLLELVELLVNSIANTPKSFATAFEVVDLHRAAFLDAEEFARMDLEAARASAAGAGAGLSAGAAVASMAPSAAIWVATTFGAASTGTAISTLSGAAATNAALAWLGGGAVAVGGGGTAAGTALLALAGPIGWTVAGAALLTSIVLFTKKRFEHREAKQQALTAVKQNTAVVEGLDAQIADLLQRSTSVRELVRTNYVSAQELFASDFRALSATQRSRLAALVNTATAAAGLLSERVVQRVADA